MLESFRDYSRSHSSGYGDYGAFDADAFKLVLYVSRQVSESNAEQVCQKWTSKSESFILEVVLVVFLSSAQFQLDNSASHFTEKYGFIFSVFVSSSNVWKEILFYVC